MILMSRPVFETRRITLPTKVAVLVLGELQPNPRSPGKRVGPKVVWSMSRNRHRTAMLRRFDPTRHEHSPWVRNVTSVWQVAVPNDLMTRLELGIGDCVYLHVSADRAAFAMTPVDAVAMAPLNPTGPGGQA